MELLQLGLMLMGAILISAALDTFLPRVSMPLVQILIGMVLYLFVDLPMEFSIESDLFLVLFIAPLLFDESKSVNNEALWKNMGGILSLAIGLVLVIVLVVGFTLHALVPSVGLAAAFALGAALGPTDAVAVMSLGKDVRLSRRQRALLSGEALLNDASGVVTFQFAIAAAVTGAFSLAEATGTFLFEFVGGIAIGAALAFVAHLVVRILRRSGVESVTFHVCYEVFLPFFSYLVASQLHMSGILAVVSAGLIFSWMPQLIGPRVKHINTFSARVSIASENVWSFLSFILNGVIFLYLGFMLPSTVTPALNETELPTPWLIGVALLVTIVVVGTRFVWVLALDLLSKDPSTNLRKGPTKHFVRNALVTTLAGPKGAVSLSIAMTIPTLLASGDAMPVRDFLLFLTCACIIVTLLLANFVVPMLSPSEDEDDDEVDTEETKVQIQIIENVIRELRRQRTEENKRSIVAVVRTLNERKASLQRDVVSKRQLRFLRQEVLGKQEVYIKEQKATDNVDKNMAERYLKRIARMKKLLRRKGKGAAIPGIAASNIENRPLASSTATMVRITEQVASSTSEERRRLDFKIGVESVAVDYLEDVISRGGIERRGAAGALLSEHKPLLDSLRVRQSMLCGIDGPLGQGAAVGVGTVDGTGTACIDRSNKDAGLEMIDDIRAEALRLELDEIQSMHDAGKLAGDVARDMREEIYLLQMSLASD